MVFRKRLPQFNSIEEIFLNLYKELQKKTTINKIEVPESGAALGSMFRNLRFTRSHRAGITHITGHVNYISLAAGRKTILTVHDSGSALYGNPIHRLFKKILWFWLPALFVKKITVVSGFSKKELSKLIPFAKKKIAVIHNPVNSILEYRPKSFLNDKPLILQIGTKSNKNLEGTIKALTNIHCTFLIIGELSKKQMELLEEYRIDYTNKKHLTFSEIKRAYEECDLVSFISLYEGFGMPVIEAQAVGRPVITSAIEPMLEVAGKGACFVDPECPEDIRTAILKIIQEKGYRDDLIQKGLENVKRFQIEEIAEQYLELYKKLANA
ncbi:MAG: glycosyltransferase family 1 protein [Candidatus Bathyarchaeota archaeon]|nr:glycosyltransferase family 1 protein [Candidatus Bathyarchaeota archaeon]